MSEPNGQGTDSRIALGQRAEDARPEPEAAAAPEDSWFTPGPKPQGYQPLDPAEMDAAGWPSPPSNGADVAAEAVAESAAAEPASGTGAEAAGGAGSYSADAGDAEGPHRPDEWFLRTGRAGLLPESMTETWVDEDTHVIPKVVDTSGAPPWAGDKSAQEVEEPPPWESGPWPGPGEERPASPHRAVSSARAARGPADETGNWQAMAALFAGIVPLILPGAVLGVLGLRQAAKSGIGRMQSWLGIAFSGIWAVVLIIVLMSTGGGSGAGCSASSQAAVSGAVTTAVRDLSGGAAKSTVITDLNQAISQANSAAAADQQVAARGALVTLTTGLERALATIQGGHSASSYTSIANELTADSAAVTSACGG